MPSLTTTIGRTFLTIVLVLRKTYINRDKEMIKEIRRKSIKDGMKQPRKTKKKKREALEREALEREKL